MNSEDYQLWHRRTAVEANNRTWDLACAEDRTIDEREEMIHLAHVALHHWSVVGGPIHRVRALQTLSHAYFKAGIGDRSLHYALLADEGLRAAAQEASDWDGAFIEMSLGNAFSLTGSRDDSDKHRNRARELGDQIANSQEREAFFAEFNR